MRVPAILLTKEGEIVEITAKVFYTRFGPQIFEFNDYDRNYRRRFVKCPKGCIARRTSTHVYDIYVDPNETIVNTYMTGFDVRLGRRIIGDVIILKRLIYQRYFVPFHYNELARFYYVRRHIYPAGSRIGRLLRIPLTYFAVRRLAGRRRSYGRVYRRKLHPRFFGRYNNDYRIRRAKKGFYFSGRRNKNRFYIPLFGPARHGKRRSPLRIIKPVIHRNKRPVRRPIPGRKIIKKTVVRRPPMRRRRSPMRGRRQPIRGRRRRQPMRGRK
jgi:hypothetical protein